MINFNELSQLQIANQELTIRAYRASDFDGLEAIFAADFFVWFFKDYANCAEFVSEKMLEFANGKLVMLVIIANQSKQIIGTSSLYDISFRHKRLEMGSSWLAKSYQGSAYNSLAKLLLIDYLLNTAGFNRIQWKTDALNEKSTQAMTKLGFYYEGKLRRHAITTSGRVRDSLVFAVTDQDWPQVAAVINERIKQKLYSSRFLD